MLVAALVLLSCVHGHTPERRFGTCGGRLAHAGGGSHGLEHTGSDSFMKHAEFTYHRGRGRHSRHGHLL